MKFFAMLIGVFFALTCYSQVNLNQGLLAYYPFNGNADDASGNGFHGTLNGGLTFTRDINNTPNSAAYFDGVDDFIEVLHDGRLGPRNAFSFVVQFKTENLTATQTLLARRERLTERHAQFQVFINWPQEPGLGYAHDFTNNGRCNTVIGPYNTYVNTGVNTVKLREWHCAIGTFDGTSLKIYLDGVLMETINTPTALMDACTTIPMTFGKYTNPTWQNQMFHGTMDEIRIYNRPLTLDEVGVLCLCKIKAGPNLDACIGSNVQLNATGAGSYTWTPSADLNNAQIANPVATPAGTSAQYIVTSGCGSKDTVDVTLVPRPQVTVTKDTSICAGESLPLSASGGATYSWAPAGSLNNSTIANPVATPSASTTYQVTAFNSPSCSNQASVVVGIRSQASFSINPSGGVCNDQTLQLAASGGDIYQWTPATGLSDPAIANPVFTPGNTTTYQVYIRDTRCTNSSTTLSTTVTVRPRPLIRAEKSGDILCPGEFSQLNASGADQYLWVPAGSLSAAQLRNPQAKPTQTTKYYVTGTDTHGCTNRDSVTVVVHPMDERLYAVPSAFTPNNDGLNDCFGLKYWETVKDVEFSVYNRWGQRIFYTNNISRCWDGTFGGAKQGAGAYVYMIKATMPCGGPIFRKGTVMLIR